jgi:hypothetical protein
VTVARAAFAALFVLSGVRTAWAEPCAARADVTGDAAAVTRVTAELARLGVTVGRAAPGCRGIVAEVELAVEGGIAVAVRDGSRRSEGRVVGDAGIAWIDSWLHDDLDGTAWLVAAPSVTVPASTVVRAVPAASPSPPVVSERAVLDRFAVTVAYEQSWSDDGAAATGATGGACLRIGRACVGGRARYSREADRPVNLTAMARSDAAIYAIASVPFVAGRMTLAPELGLGVGRRTTRRLDGCPPEPPPMCDPTDPSCAMPSPSCVDASGAVHVGDAFSSTTYTPRLAAALRIAVPLFDHVWLDGLASLTFGPFGHVGSFSSPVMPDGTNPGNLPASALALPGEASGAIQLGVGIRIGAP